MPRALTKPRHICHLMFAYMMDLGEIRLQSHLPDGLIRTLTSSQLIDGMLPVS